MGQRYRTFVEVGGRRAYKEVEAKNLIYGDTDSVYMSLEKLFPADADPKAVTEFADTLGSKVNAAFPAFMKEVFNVSDERAKAIATDREVVSDKSLFLAKKKYCMHVINDEGLVVDKMKTMGVELARTDTAECVKVMLRRVVEMLMDKKPYEAVREYVDEFKKVYHGLSMVEIGRPTSIRTLAKYEQAVAAAGGNLDACSVGHIKAALFYNSLCEPHDQKIRAGDKVVVVYIIGQKYPSIAIPRDADVLPSWLDRMLIDWPLQWSKVEEKLNIYLRAVGYDYETRQSEFVGKFITF